VLSSLIGIIDYPSLTLFAGRCFPKTLSDGHCVTLCFTHRTVIGRSEVLPGNTLGRIFGTRRQNMIAFLALWLCVLSVAAIYYTIPPSGMRPDIYEIALWILSSCALATSAIIIVVSLVSPQPINPKWLDSPLSPPHYTILHN
jgi:hypothetical protein